MKKIRRKKEPKPFRNWNRQLTFAEEVIILAVLVLFIIIIAIIT